MDRTKVLVVKKMLFFITCSFAWSMKLSKARMVSSLFVLGDSQVDVGNNNHLPVSIAKANFRHNGIDFPDRHATGRFSNGKNPADFLAEKLGLPSPRPILSLSRHNRPSYRKGVNFASGGSGILDGTDKIFGQAMPLSMQVDKFLGVHEAMSQKIGPSHTVKHFSKSLVAIVAGSNDLFDYFRHEDKKEIKGNKTFFENINTPQELVVSLANKLKLQIKRLYQSGARKFVVSGAGALGCIPAQRATIRSFECNEETNFWALKFNEEVKRVLRELTLELQTLKYSFFDLYALMQDVISNPSFYGFKEIRAACCGLGRLRTDIACLPFSIYCRNRKNHMFWDLYHPTEAMSLVVADNLFDGPTKYCIPMNVNPTVWEISSHMVLKRRKDYDEASDENAWRLLAEISLCDDRFQEVNALIFEAAIDGAEDGIENIAED